MSHLENLDNFKIETNDIWICERSYFFDNEEKYGYNFASNLLDKLQFIILKNGTPNFGIEMKVNSPEYYERNYKTYSDTLSIIKERFALGFFFSGDNCFSYSKPIEITPKNNDDYLYWFTLKLRQYDLNLLKISAFLSYQQKKYFPKKESEFIELVKFGLIQYPELLTERVKETVSGWTNKQNKNAISTKAKKTIEPKIFKWMESDPELKNTQLTYLYSELIDKFLIDKISIKNFKGNFNSENNLTPINWITAQYPLIYFIDQLKTYLHPDIYTKNSQTVSINTFAPHFTWKDQIIVESNWRKYKSEGERNSTAIFDRIDQIIKGIPTNK